MDPNTQAQFPASGRVPGSNNRKPLNKKLILTVLISVASVILIATAIILVLVSLKGSPSSNQTDDKALTGVRAGVDDKKTFDKDTTATFGHFEVSINKVTKDYVTDDGSIPITKGYRFLLINITAKNIDSDAPHLLTDFEFGILDDQTVLAASNFVHVDPILKNGAVEPGASVTGNLVFEVPANKNDLKLYYNTSIYNEKAQKLEKIEYILPF